MTCAKSGQWSQRQTTRQVVPPGPIVVVWMKSAPLFETNICNALFRKRARVITFVQNLPWFQSSCRIPSSSQTESEFGNMGIWQYGIRTQWHKDKKRNWGEATETMHSIVDCCLCYVIDCTRKTFRIYLIYKRRVEFWQLGLMKAIWQVGCK